MTTIYKVWIHVEEIDEDKNYYQDIATFNIGKFDTEAEAWDYAEILSQIMEKTDELMSAAKDIIDTWECGDLAGAVRRLNQALNNMEV